MKRVLYILVLLATFLGSCRNNSPKPVEVDPSQIHSFTDSPPRFVHQAQLDKLLKRLSDGDNLVFTDLYPLIDTLPEMSADRFLLAERLERLGFTQTGGGNGNWENGPRFRHREYENENLRCRLYKAYVYNEPDKGGDYTLVAYEQIECENRQDAENQTLKTLESMNFRASFCDPFKADIIEIGPIEKEKILDLFDKIPWSDYLAKMATAKESEIHYSPSLEIENKDNRNGLVASAIDGREWYIFYKRPKRVKVLFGLFERMNNNYLTEVHGQTEADVKICFEALIINDLQFLEDKIK